MAQEKNINSFLSKSGKYVILVAYIALLYFIFPIGLGLFIAYLLYPLFDFFKQLLKLPFSIIVIGVSLLLFSLFGAFIFILLQNLLKMLPTIHATLHAFSLDSFSHPLFPFFIDKLSTLLNDVTLFIIDLIKNLLSSFFELFLFLITFYFSLFESKKNRLWFFTYTPKAYRAIWARYFTKTMNLIGYFILVELQLFTLTFILLSIGFHVLHFEAPFAKAFLIALADCLPFLGIGIFLVPLSIYYFFINNLFLGTALIALYIIVQLIRQLTESKLWSQTLHLRMIHTFLISAASVLLFGFYGILISPILLMVAIKLKQNPIFAK